MFNLEKKLLIVHIKLFCLFTIHLFEIITCLLPEYVCEFYSTHHLISPPPGGLIGCDLGFCYGYKWQLKLTCNIAVPFYNECGHIYYCGNIWRSCWCVPQPVESLFLFLLVSYLLYFLKFHVMVGRAKVCIFWKCLWNMSFVSLTSCVRVKTWTMNTISYMCCEVHKPPCWTITTLAWYNIICCTG